MSFKCTECHFNMTYVGVRKDHPVYRCFNCGHEFVHVMI